jgi:putative ABC transport system permease protein
VLIPFVTAIILVSCLFIIYQQISFLREQQLGFDVKQKLVVRDSEVYDSSYSAKLTTFKKELIRIPGIKTSTYVSVVPGEPIIYSANSVRRIKADHADVN